MKKALGQIRDWSQLLALVLGVIFSFEHGLMPLLGAISAVLVIESVFIRQ